jgi:hypothetical protein
MLRVVMLSVIMLSVVMLGVVAPIGHLIMLNALVRPNIKAVILVFRVTMTFYGASTLSLTTL